MNPAPTARAAGAGKIIRRGSCNHIQDRTHAKTKNITNSSAKNTHQNTDTRKGIVIGAGNDRRRSGTADIGDRCRRDHAKIPVEDLGEDVHTDNVDRKNEHAVNDPHRSFDQRIERSLRSEQGDDGVQQDAGKIFNSRKLAERGHCADQTENGDEQRRAGALVEHVKADLIETVIHDKADLLRQRGDDQSKADKPDPVGSFGLLFLVGDLCVGSGCSGLKLGGVRLNGLVPLGGVADHEDQKGDPHRVADGIKRERAGIRAGVDGKRVLHGDHVAAAADPAAAESAKAHPDVGADRSLHQHERADKADHDGEGGAEEADEHLRAELEDLTDVAAEQHREDHRVGEVVFQSGVCGLGLGHIPHAQRAQEHGDEVAENDRRNVLEEFLHAALGAFLQRDESGCHKEQHRHM